MIYFLLSGVPEITVFGYIHMKVKCLTKELFIFFFYKIIKDVIFLLGSLKNIFLPHWVLFL